jgi:hypothetical protein
MFVANPFARGPIARYWTLATPLRTDRVASTKPLGTIV